MSSVGAPGEFDRLSDDGLLSALRERFARLETDLKSDAGSDTARH